MSEIKFYSAEVIVETKEGNETKMVLCSNLEDAENYMMSRFKSVVSAEIKSEISLPDYCTGTANRNFRRAFK